MLDQSLQFTDATLDELVVRAQHGYAQKMYQEGILNKYDVKRSWKDVLSELKIKEVEVKQEIAVQVGQGKQNATISVYAGRNDAYAMTQLIVHLLQEKSKILKFSALQENGVTQISVEWPPLLLSETR